MILFSNKSNKFSKENLFLLLGYSSFFECISLYVHLIDYSIEYKSEVNQRKKNSSNLIDIRLLTCLQSWCIFCVRWSSSHVSRNASRIYRRYKNPVFLNKFYLHVLILHLIELLILHSVEQWFLLHVILELNFLFFLQPRKRFFFRMHMFCFSHKPHEDFLLI
jgi:hypothetical protein